MKRFIKAVRKALENKNWYSALTLSLTLPDICAKIENPNIKSTKKRYVDWYNRYMLDKYSRNIGPENKKHIFLKGEDCYALRCSYLHEGTDDITMQRAQKVLENFHFIAPKKGNQIHCNQSNSVLQLQVDLFCEDICCGIEEWLKDISPEVSQRMNSLIKIHNQDGTILF